MSRKKRPSRYEFDSNTRKKIFEQQSQCQNPNCPTRRYGHRSVLTVHHRHIQVHEAVQYDIDPTLVSHEENGLVLCDACHKRIHRREAEERPREVVFRELSYLFHAVYEVAVQESVAVTR